MHACLGVGERVLAHACVRGGGGGSVGTCVGAWGWGRAWVWVREYWRMRACVRMGVGVGVGGNMRVGIFKSVFMFVPMYAF